MTLLTIGGSVHCAAISFDLEEVILCVVVTIVMATKSLWEDYGKLSEVCGSTHMKGFKKASTLHMPQIVCQSTS